MRMHLNLPKFGLLDFSLISVGHSYNVTWNAYRMSPVVKVVLASSYQSELKCYILAVTWALMICLIRIPAALRLWVYVHIRQIICVHVTTAK